MNLSLEEQEGGNEISQRVHTRKAKNHYKMKTNKNNKDNKNVKSYRALPPIYTSELIKNIKKLGNLKSNTKQNISNCKNKKTINMLKNKERECINLQATITEKSKEIQNLHDLLLNERKNFQNDLRKQQEQ